MIGSLFTKMAAFKGAAIAQWILPPWVPVPSTSSTLLSFIVNLCYICHVKRTKINKKSPGLAHFFKKNCLQDWAAVATGFSRKQFFGRANISATDWWLSKQVSRQTLSSTSAKEKNNLKFFIGSAKNEKLFFSRRRCFIMSILVRCLLSHSCFIEKIFVSEVNVKKL